MDDLAVETFKFHYEGDPIEIFYISGENSKRDYMYFNGIASPVQNSINLLTEIADRGYRVWGVNMPGHGGSAQIHNLSWDIMIDIVRQIVKEYKIEKPILSGFSLGGGVALRYAAEYPDDFDSVRVLAPLCFNLPALTELMMAGVTFTIKLAQDILKNSAGKESVPIKTYPMYYLKNYRHVLFDGAIDPAKFKKLGKRIRVVVSFDDSVIDVADVRRAMKMIKGVTIKTIHGFSHEMYYSADKTISKIVADLLE